MRNGGRRLPLELQRRRPSPAIPNWKKDDAGMRAYLGSRHHDQLGQRDAQRPAARAGLRRHRSRRMTDKEVVEQVSRWLFNRSKYRKMFCTFYVGFAAGRPAVLPGMEEAFARDRGDPRLDGPTAVRARTVGQGHVCQQDPRLVHFDGGVRDHGPAGPGHSHADDPLHPPGRRLRPAQVDMVEKGLTHNQMRHDILSRRERGARQLQQPHLLRSVCRRTVAAAELRHAGTKRGPAAVPWANDQSPHVQRPERGQPGGDLGYPLRPAPARRGVPPRQSLSPAGSQRPLRQVRQV